MNFHRGKSNQYRNYQDTSHTLNPQLVLPWRQKAVKYTNFISLLKTSKKD
jgi:hypothetical protein